MAAKRVIGKTINGNLQLDSLRLDPPQISVAQNFQCKVREHLLHCPHGCKHHTLCCYFGHQHHSKISLRSTHAANGKHCTFQEHCKETSGLSVMLAKGH